MMLFLDSTGPWVPARRVFAMLLELHSGYIGIMENKMEATLVQ